MKALLYSLAFLSTISLVGFLALQLDFKLKLMVEDESSVAQSRPSRKAWPAVALPEVYMNMENSVHYAFNTPEGAREWNASLPPNADRLRIGDSPQLFTISLFHQLRCLDIIRNGIAVFRSSKTPDPPDALVHHCMNYIRQMIMCRANTDLESVRSHVGPRVAVSETTHRCRDWTRTFYADDENTIRL
ncbi:hypothetical protein CCMSSC00406_0006584 [Pleurotus cornucopiae]|uniref:Uncharacterized protein n=1 Tax=Pleurotus cornucopiae TaxID=5321 RepID=A0ACB7IVR4_PLECO|nr:hypothetical protein CCMSSC00406_0006584 [Pleurotus cornucopiae]